ncbi:MAG: hypothetical protein ACFFDO_05470 [Candidatus Thorarchaeota archaeon]
MYSDYDGILKESLIQDVHWYEEEFDLIFKNKNNYTVKDLQLANLILEKLAKILGICQSEQLMDSLASTINNIKKRYPDFF